MADAKLNETTGDYNSWSKEKLIQRILQLEFESKKARNCENNCVSRKCSKKREFQWEGVSKRHILLKFLYMGWEYHGYASQVDTTETVEEHLMTALRRSCLIRERETSNYHRCGRTDAGVSAFTQVISIDVRSKFKDPSEDNSGNELDYCKMLNRILPQYIRCYSWAHVSSEVSARFDCTSRSYNYFFPRGNLDIDAMQEAAKHLEGTHDFRNLCKMDVGNGVVEFVRTVDVAEILPYADDVKGERNESPDVIEHLFDIEKYPCKPQYHMASALPLALSTADYDNHHLSWNVSAEETEYIYGQLQASWTEFAIKACFVRESMLRTSKLRNEPIKWRRQTALYTGVMSKSHIPILKRATCQSLEERIHRVESKKRKLDEGPD